MEFKENNYQPNTGIVNAVDSYPSAAMWDIASYLIALVSAHKIGLIDQFEFNRRLLKLLETLNSMPLYENKVWNKVYHTQTMQMVNYANQPGVIGFSPMDIGRMLTAFKIIKNLHPEFAANIDNIILRINFCPIVDKCGNSHGENVMSDGTKIKTQEGRLGYEEYGAQGFSLWGFNTKTAELVEPYSHTSIYSVPIPFDSRDPRIYGSNFVLSETYILGGLEFGWGHTTWHNNKSLKLHPNQWQINTAAQIFEVQKRRYQNTLIITARTEHQLDRPPYFIYDTIYSDGFAWNTLTMKKEYRPEFAAVALKAAIGFWALYDDPYSDLLFEYVAELYVPEKGFYEGIYENGMGTIKIFTANNNGIILEALAYKKDGPLLKDPIHPTRWEILMRDHPQNCTYTVTDKCYPIAECPSTSSYEACPRMK